MSVLDTLNIQYLRLQRTGEGRAPIYLNDLDAPPSEHRRTNVKQNVYIPAAPEVLDLVVTDRVLLSYTQGGISKLIRDKVITAQFLNPTGFDNRFPPPPLTDVPILSRYVSLMGSDDNDGTSIAPWRTLKHAVETLKPLGKHIYKRVCFLGEGANPLSGIATFVEDTGIHINVARWQFVSESGATIRIQQNPSSAPNLPLIAITNLTDAGMAALTSIPMVGAGAKRPSYFTNTGLGWGQGFNMFDLEVQDAGGVAFDAFISPVQDLYRIEVTFEGSFDFLSYALNPDSRLAHFLVYAGPGRKSIDSLPNLIQNYILDVVFKGNIRAFGNVRGNCIYLKNALVTCTNTGHQVLQGDGSSQPAIILDNSRIRLIEPNQSVNLGGTTFVRCGNTENTPLGIESYQGALGGALPPFFNLERMVIKNCTMRASEPVRLASNPDGLVLREIRGNFRFSWGFNLNNIVLRSQPLDSEVPIEMKKRGNSQLSAGTSLFIKDGYFMGTLRMDMNVPCRIEDTTVVSTSFFTSASHIVDRSRFQGNVSISAGALIFHNCQFDANVTISADASPTFVNCSFEGTITTTSTGVTTLKWPRYQKPIVGAGPVTIIPSL